MARNRPRPLIQGVLGQRKLSGLAGTSPHFADYGKQQASRLLPAVLPYELGTSAAFDFAGFNGRGLADDAMNVILTLTVARRSAFEPNNAGIMMNRIALGVRKQESECGRLNPKSQRSRDPREIPVSRTRSPSTLPMGKSLVAKESVWRKGMAAERTNQYPSLVFVHRDHEFVVTALPDSADILLQIADQYGRFRYIAKLDISESLFSYWWAT